MKHSKVYAANLKVRPIPDPKGVFELKTSSGLSFGFVLNGTMAGPSLVVAGAGPTVRSAFQQVLFWPAKRQVRGRIALIVLDRLDETDTGSALREVETLMGEVHDSLFLPMSDGETDADSHQAYETIENFCVSNSSLLSGISTLDCAAI